MSRRKARWLANNEEASHVLERMELGLRFLSGCRLLHLRVSVWPAFGEAALATLSGAVLVVLGSDFQVKVWNVDCLSWMQRPRLERATNACAARVVWL